MKILYFASSFPRPERQTIATWAKNQVDAFLRQGIDLAVLSILSWIPFLFLVKKIVDINSNEKCPKMHKWSGFNTYYIRSFLNYRRSKLLIVFPQLVLFFNWIFARKRILKIANELKPDLIYAQSSIPNGYFALKLSEAMNIPYVITNHCFEEIEDCAKYSTRKKLIEKINHQASFVAGVADRMTLSHNKIFKTVQMHTIRNGSNVEIFSENRIKPNELTGKIIVFCAAMFVERKGILDLLTAFSRISKKYPNAVLRIAGDGPQKANIVNKIEELGLKEAVELLGLIPQGEVFQELSWCRFFALPSWDEPFATVYLEAMAAGKPFICCSDGGMAEVVENGKEAFIVDPRDIPAISSALDRLLEDEKLVKEMGNRGRSLVLEKLNWDEHAKTMKNIFEKAIENYKYSNAK